MADLERFVSAQAPVYGQVLAELSAGRKQTHWMWFVFPQLRGLGRSGMAQHYGLAGLAEARAYLGHPVLGSRLVACSALVLAAPHTPAEAIFGPIDALKLRSCMTLFERAASAEPVFAQVLERHCGGQRDPQTLAMLAGR
ncbi:DUF1810 domain-containing protein [Aquincola sp. MAHUQ-54]|uniref:DUF1810 domain-containing protein n=1 Tax=Aquincola agrisoli TaxID=3119538 RepID=A0AAW9QKT5_9BURK